MRYLVAGFGVTLAACGFQPSGASGAHDDAAGSGSGAGDANGDAPHVDARPIDAPIAIDSPTCYGAGPIRACPTVVNGDTTFNSATTINTDSDARCRYQNQQSPGGPVCVIAYTNLTINKVVTLTGSHPIAFVVVNTLTINSGGELDASSTHGNQGPGADVGVCTGNLDGGVAVATPGGGGAGGGLGSVGAGGGSVGGSSGGSPATLPATPSVLVGGCRGGAGGNNVAANGGHGGGAIDVIAKTLVINSKGGIDASGGGGRGGAVVIYGGGGGGGGGGMIVLDVQTLNLDGGGYLAADGGGGGGGGTLGQTGNDGHEDAHGNATDVSTGPGGGSKGGGGAGDGGDGDARGAGGAKTGNGGNTGTGGGGGGGGGGGMGIIHGVGASISNTNNVSPPPT